MPDSKKSEKKQKKESPSNSSSRPGESSRASSSHRISITALLNSPRDTASNQQSTSRARSSSQTQEHSNYDPGQASSSSGSKAKRVATIKCILCSRTFDNRHQLERHMHSHTNQVICGDCGNAFSTSSFAAHKNVHRHGRVAPHKCQFCSATYFDKMELHRHEQKHIDQFKKPR